MKKLMALMLSLVIALSLAACGQTTEQPKKEDTKKENTDKPEAKEEKTPEAKTDEKQAETNKEIVPLKWVLIGGGQPKNYDAWKEHINKYLADKIGVELDVQIISWGD